MKPGDKLWKRDGSWVWNEKVVHCCHPEQSEGNEREDRVKIYTQFNIELPPLSPSFCYPRDYYLTMAILRVAEKLPACKV